MSFDHEKLNDVINARRIEECCKAQFYLEDGNIYDWETGEVLPVCFVTEQKGRRLEYPELVCILSGYPLEDEETAILVNLDTEYPADADNIAICSPELDEEMEKDPAIIKIREEEPDADMVHFLLLNDVLKDVRDFDQYMESLMDDCS